MRTKWFWPAMLALPVAVVGSLVYAKSHTQAKDDSQQAKAAGYICPITGEELPCPNCCPLNHAK